MIEMNSIIQGDCLKVMNDIDNKSIDMILCDLPYGTTACKWDSIIPLEPLWKQYKRIIKDNGAIVLTASQPFTTDLINSNREWFRYTWVWDKVNGANFMNIKNRPFKTHEDVVIFSKTSKFVFNPQKILRTPKSLKRDDINSIRTIKRTDNICEHYNIIQNNSTTLKQGGLKHPVDIIQFSIAEVGRYRIKHPTKKPLALFEYLIRTYTNEGDLVLDNCIGSGTTAVACANLNRNFIGIELNPDYIEIAKARLKAVEHSKSASLF